MTRRHGNADLWSAQPRGSAAGEGDLTQRHGSRLGVSPGGTMTRRHGNADLWSAQPRGSAAGETNLTQRHGPYSNAYFKRSSGAGAGHPASRQYAVRPPPAGGADRRSAFPCRWHRGAWWRLRREGNHLREWRCAARGPSARGADRRSAFQAVPAIWRVGGCVVRCPPATVPTGGRHPLRGGDEGAVAAPAAKQRRFELTFGYRF